MRFLQSIDKKDFEDVPESPLYQKLHQPRPANKQPMFLPDGASEDYGLVFNSSSEAQHPKTLVSSQSPSAIGNTGKPPLVSQSSFGSGANSPGAAPQRIMLNRSGSISSSSASPSSVVATQMPLPISNQLETILNRHALALLNNFRIRDLAAFSAHLNYDMVTFFKQSTTAFKTPPEQFPIILMKLHAQFAWPYPVSSELIIQESPSNSTTISVVDETSSVSSEDVMSLTSNGFVLMPMSINSSSTTSINRYATTDFNRKVFEKLCEKSKNRGTRQAEDEIAFILRQLVKSGALEWCLLLSILRRDVNDLSEALLNEGITLNRLGSFLKCARRGLAKLLEWAEGNW